MQGLIFSIIQTQGDALCYRITPLQGLSFFRVHAGLNLFYYSNTERCPMLSYYAHAGLKFFPCRYRANLFYYSNTGRCPMLSYYAHAGLKFFPCPCRA